MSTPTKNPAKAPPQTHDRVASALLLRPRDVAALLAISVRGVWRLAGRDEIPRPVKIGNSTRWRASEVEAFIAQSSVATDRACHPARVRR